MRDVMRDHFMGRLPADLPSDYRRAISEAFGTVDRAADKVQSIKQDGRYTMDYRRKAIAEAISTGPVSDLGRLRSTYSDEIRQIRAEKAALAPKELDRADTFAEMQRAELRSWLRSLPEEERVRMAMTDAAVMEAIIYAPSVAMTGIPAEVHERVLADAVASANAPQIARIEAKEALVTTVLSAISLAEMELSSVAN